MHRLSIGLHARRFTFPRWGIAAIVAVSACRAPLAVADGLAATQFLNRYCVQCHGPRKQEGKLSLHELGEAQFAGPQVQTWKALLEKLASGEMPPEDEPQPTPAERDGITDWIEQQLEAAGEAVDPTRQSHPNRGNWVDHDALFSGQPSGPIATRGRLWRMTGDGYDEFILSLSERHYLGFARHKMRPPWELSPHAGFRDYANQHRIGEPEIEHHLRIAQRVAEGMLLKLNKSSGIQEFKDLVRADADATDNQIEAAAAAAVDGILGREPTEREQQRYARFLRDNIESLGVKGAVAQLLVAVLCHPEVIYRIELPIKGEPRTMLPPRDLARSISYALTDREPDERLRTAAVDGRLTTAEQVRQHVERMLHDEEIAKSRVLRFFQEYFGYTNAVDVFKDETTRKETGLRGGWQPDFFVSDTDQTILWILARDKQVLRELLTTTATFTATGNSREAQRVMKNPDKPFDSSAQTALDIYEIRVERSDWSPEKPLPMPPQHRRGILTHPSWLIAHSTNFDNHAIARGHWIRERLLGGKIPEVPVTVDAQLPDEPEHPLRHRMRVTREAYCWNCHRQMDPLGLPLEQFDHFGRYRDKELGQPVDATGSIEASGDPKLDGPVKDPFELIEKLASSERVEQVFVRHAFRYFMGRNETLADGPVLVAAHRAYVDGGGSMNALITSLLTSDAFLYRSAAIASGPPTTQGERTLP